VTPAGSAVAFRGRDLSLPVAPAQAALADFTLRVAPGETVALVGASGAGKSTVFQLLLRFYDPAAGPITLDGVPTSALALHDLRQRIGIVPQDAVIFSASALENIRYGKPGASDAEVHAAASAAFADGFIPPARGLRHLPGRTRCAPVGRAAPAHRDCPRHAQEPAAAAAGRSHQRAGRRERAHGAGRAGIAMRTAPRWSSPTGWPRCRRPTALWCWTMAASWSKARTPR
jgi:hypothetical protein